MTSVFVAIITVAIITVLVTRPGAVPAIKGIGTFTASSIKALLGT